MRFNRIPKQICQKKTKIRLEIFDLAWIFFSTKLEKIDILQLEVWISSTQLFQNIRCITTETIVLVYYTSILCTYDLH